ncbi:unnamed protein product, partial [Owenia fusiformis]
KLALTLLSKTGPYSLYDKVKQWLCNLSTNIAIDPGFQIVNDDVVSAFDNNQILKKTWNVSKNKKFECSVVTMICTFTIGNSGAQKNPNIAPGTWKHRTLSNQQVERIKRADIYKQHHDEKLDTFLEERMHQVYSEQVENETTYQDEIDTNVIT